MPFCELQAMFFRSGSFFLQRNRSQDQPLQGFQLVRTEEKKTFQNQFIYVKKAYFSFYIKVS